eukprot:TRINITY_DN92200_c0_g1_i1.p1 TRINITY_DN92200_c0_g1~~TRINITY_DN92200_c0_g1_i1.p1  ORF type:complete len:283 (+),score=57.67 TRINITY_DN92200_c0_g1_i1:47-850(+)
MLAVRNGTPASRTPSPPTVVQRPAASLHKLFVPASPLDRTPSPSAVAARRPQEPAPAKRRPCVVRARSQASLGSGSAKSSPRSSRSSPSGSELLAARRRFSFGSELPAHGGVKKVGTAALRTSASTPALAVQAPAAGGAAKTLPSSPNSAATIQIQLVRPFELGLMSAVEKLQSKDFEQQRSGGGSTSSCAYAAAAVVVAAPAAAAPAAPAAAGSSSAVRRARSDSSGRSRSQAEESPEERTRRAVDARLLRALGEEFGMRPKEVAA